MRQKLRAFKRRLVQELMLLMVLVLTVTAPRALELMLEQVMALVMALETNSPY